MGHQGKEIINPVKLHKWVFYCGQPRLKWEAGMKERGPTNQPQVQEMYFSLFIENILYVFPTGISFKCFLTIKCTNIQIFDANCYYIFYFGLMLSCNEGESHFHNGRLEMDFGWNEIFNVPAAPFHTVNLSNVLPNEKFYRLFLFKVSNLATSQNIFKSKITWK